MSKRRVERAIRRGIITGSLLVLHLGLCGPCRLLGLLGLGHSCLIRMFMGDREDA